MLANAWHCIEFVNEIGREVGTSFGMLLEPEQDPLAQEASFPAAESAPRSVHSEA